MLALSLKAVNLRAAPLSGVEECRLDVVLAFSDATAHPASVQVYVKCIPAPVTAAFGGLGILGVFGQKGSNSQAGSEWCFKFSANEKPEAMQGNQ
jgi:hypothetical protein